MRITVQYFIERYHDRSLDKIITDPAELPRHNDVLQLFTGRCAYLVKKVISNHNASIYKVYLLPHDERSARAFYTTHRHQPQNQKQW